MSQIDDLKLALNNLSSKPDVLTKEAHFAKAKMSQPIGDSQSLNDENKQKLFEEFNTSVELLTTVFKQSRFDHIMGLVMDPLRLLVLNFLMAFIKGMAFMFGAIVILWIFFSIYSDLIF